MRRLAIRLSASTLLILAILDGCARDRACPGGRCGTAVVVTGAEADVLFPPATRTDVGVALSDLIFTKLADIGPDANTVGDSGFAPMLARSWRREDSVTVRFTLRPEARWHDGVPVSAEDVAFTHAVYSDSLVGAAARARLARISSVTAADSHTVVFRFREPYPEQLFDAVYHMRILPRHALDSVPRERLSSHPFGRNPVGGGPYRLVRWQAGESVELRADSLFFLGRPGLARVLWRFTPDPAAALMQLTSGEADVLNALGGPEAVARVRAAPQLRAVEYPVAVYGFIGFNVMDAAGRDAPHLLFGDADVRRALTMAVDRQAVVRAVLGEFGEVPVGPVSRALWIWSDSVEQLPFDTARARQMLLSLGWRDTNRDGVLDRAGRRLEFTALVPVTSGLRRRAAVVVQEQLRRLGVSMKISEMEFNTFMSRTAAHRFDAYFGAWAQDPSPASIQETWTGAGLAGFNYGRYANPAVDSLVREAMSARDRAVAQARWREAVSRINADAPAIWLYAPLGVAGVHERFRNVTIRADQWAASLWTWRVDPARMLERDRVATGRSGSRP